MVYLLQLHINPFSEWHLAGASVSYGHFFLFDTIDMLQVSDKKLVKNKNKQKGPV